MNAVTNTCPPLEDIAAFLDGKLSEDERAQVVAHLADCEPCYAVFADSARFQLEEAKVVPFYRRPAFRKMWPLAAVLVLGLTFIPFYLQSSRMPEMVSTELVDPAALAQVPLDDFWDDKRGHSEAAVLDTSRPFEVLVGAHLVDLRLALARNDREASHNALARINGVIDELLFVQEQVDFYKKAVVDLDEGRRTPEEIAGDAARVEADLTELYSGSDSPYLAFGKWTEAGRLSSRARNPTFFEDRDNRRFPVWLLRNTEEELDQGVVQTVKRISHVLKRGDPAELPYSDLAQQFEAILEHYQREADAASDL